MMQRKDEILAKKAKLAELRRQREEREQRQKDVSKRDSTSGAPDVQILSHSEAQVLTFLSLAGSPDTFEGERSSGA